MSTVDRCQTLDQRPVAVSLVVSVVWQSLQLEVLGPRFGSGLIVVHLLLVVCSSYSSFVLPCTVVVPPA